MKCQVVSDIHGEAYADTSFLWKHVTPSLAPTIVMAGDIHSKRFEEMVTEIAQYYEHVVCVYGNHSWYGRDQKWRADKTLIPSNVHILDRDVVEIDGVVFIGATLWTDFDNQDPLTMHAAQSCINDFRVIKSGNGRFHPSMAYDRHVKDCKYIDLMIEQNRGKKTVIVTHFMPSYQMVNKRWKQNPGTDTLNRYFSANCDYLIEKSEAAAWICGHSHDEFDAELYGVRCVLNPLGYPKENPFYNDLVIEV